MPHEMTKDLTLTISQNNKVKPPNSKLPTADFSAGHYVVKSFFVYNLPVKIMIDTEQIKEILSLYGKYGWTLRRVLLSDALRVRISDQLEKLFGAETVFVTAEINALWFSRAAHGGETWEIRHLSQTPFALVEVFDEDDDEELRAERLREMEAQIKERIVSKTPSKNKTGAS